MKKIISINSILFGLLIFLISCNQTSKSGTSESVGISSDTLELVEKSMQEYIDSGKLAGISTLVLKNGQLVQRANFGFSDIENHIPIEDNTIFRIFSMTKPVTAVALMSLYDEGKFKLDDKVSQYIPEFKETLVYQSEGSDPALVPQSEEMTIRHLLTHTSGLTYGWDPNAYVDSLYRVTGAGGWEGTIGEKVKIMAGLPLKYQPGTKWEYSLSIDVAGYLVEVLSGIPLDQFFKGRIFDPLKMEDTGFYTPEEKHNRLSALYYIDKEGNLKAIEGEFKDAFKKPVTMFSGGGGLVSTMDDYSRFCLMLLNGGELDGTRILQESTVQMIMSDQLPEAVNYRAGKGYGLAGQVNLEGGEYSWAGAASTNFWIDPENEMIIITYTQLMPSNHEYAYTFKNWVDRALLE